MLQYIINASLIWLSCLVIYDLLLRRETFHQLNRAYLLLSLAAGLLLPTLNLANIVSGDNPSFRQPAEQVYQIKQNVASTATPANSSEVDVALILWAIYLVGIGFGIALIVKEAFQLIRLYTNGIRTKEGRSIIVETNEDHCPYSFFNIVFIKSRSDYDRQEWSLLLTHEKEHNRHFHSIDKLALMLLRIVFWFHPLPHVYYKRLMMVHEFQADLPAKSIATDYGSFLLSQSLMQGVPSVTHSFNYSPIKNRIAMLTGTKSSKIKLVKYLCVIPLTLLLLFFCTQTSFSGERTRKGNKVYFKGNEIELQGHKADTIPLEDPVTGQIMIKVVMLDSTPISINGKPIFGDEMLVTDMPNNVRANSGGKYIAPVFAGEENNMDQYLFNKLKTHLNKLEDGIYILDISRLVIDDKGNIAYYESGGIAPSFRMPKEQRPAISDYLRNTINQKLIELLDGSARFKPAVKDGKPLNVRLRLDISGGSHQIEVKDHIARLN